MADTPDEKEWVLLGKADYAEAKRILAQLAERGIELKLSAQSEDCQATGRCKVTVEVFARFGDMERVQEFFQHERIRDLGGLPVDPSLLGEVFDTEKPTAKCPACGTEFPTTSGECPECGLCFG